MNKRKRYGVTTQYVLLFGVLLLMMNIILGLVMLRRSTAAMESMVRRNMLSISETAAALIDGDALGKLTKNDVGSPGFRMLLGELTAFTYNEDVEYIYAVRQVGEDEFIFTVDADPEDPADFGEAVLVTDALRSAARGVPTVDDAAAADEWGNFYSAYSPVYDSEGRIAGIIGVDFDSVWYEEQITSQTIPFAVITALSVLLGAVIVLFFTRNVGARLKTVNGELAALSDDVDALADEFLSSTGYTPDVASPAANEIPGDEIEALGGRIRYMQEEMRSFVKYAHNLAYTDALTGAGNTTAYIAAQDRVGDGIAAGRASFYVVIFDINALKQVNDRWGHAAGDQIIRGAASVIQGVFGSECTYRIGGDEFIVLSERALPEEDIAGRMAQVEAGEAAFNAAHPELGAELSLSMGAAVYRPEEDASFREVFIRADDRMYNAKSDFYRRSGLPSRDP